MDRYLARNYSLVVELRKNQKVQRLELADVRSKYDNYPLGDHTEKLSDVLKAVHRYVSLDTSVPAEDYMELSVASFPGPIPLSAMQTRMRNSFVEQRKKVLPSPEYSHTFLNDIASQLHQLISEEEDKETRLRAREKELSSLIEKTFNRADLMQHQYRLHAVAIHQGQANAGHYWAYVKKVCFNFSLVILGDDDISWEKFNDKNVERAEWEQIEKESVGAESRTSSAYFLVYVSTAAKWLFDSDLSVKMPLDRIPLDLRERIAEQNAELFNEIERYNLRKTQGQQSDVNPQSESPLELTAKETALIDPEMASYTLGTDVEPFFDADQREHFRNQVYSLRQFTSRSYREKVSHDIVLGHQSKLLYVHLVKPVLIQLLEETDQSVAVNDDPFMKIKIAYDKLLNNWYDRVALLDPPPNHLDDPRRSVLHFWRAANLRMPAKVYRYILLKALKDSDNLHVFKELFIASIFYSLFIQVLFFRISHLYDLLRNIWSAVRQMLTDMDSIPVYTAHLSNALVSCEKWTNMLRLSAIVRNLYDRMCSELNDVRKYSVGHPVNFSSCIIDSFVIRGLTIIPYMNLHAVMGDYLLGAAEPHVVQLLDNAVPHMQTSLNTISRWASAGDQTAEKIVSHVRDMLSMISSMFPQARSPLKADYIQKLLSATDSTQNFPTESVRIICHGEDIMIEVEKVLAQRSVVGLCDEADANCTYERLMSVVSNIIMSGFQNNGD
uniref:ubiquitinyl hydrolase 1 n=1 Tax=Heterorhabditis bacteriophora TaxID=37862 RepID=A0A1I7X9H7_HETBA